MLGSAFWSTSAEFPTHYELVAQRSAALNIDFSNGKYEPFVWPHCLFGLYAVFAYLFLPPNTSRVLYYLRYPLFIFNVYWSVKSTLVCRSHNPPVQYGIGLINSFACLWLSFHLIWSDPRTGTSIIAWRNTTPIEKQEADRHQTQTSGTDDVAQTATGSFKGSRIQSNDRNRSQQKLLDPLQNLEATSPATKDVHLEQEFYWQSLPVSFQERVYWVSTVVLSLRGEGTTHGIRALPGLPSPVKESLRRTSPGVKEPAWLSQQRSPIYFLSSRSSMIYHYSIVVFTTYLMLDVAKYLIRNDPYFTGFVPITAPLPLPAKLVAGMPTFAQSLITFGVFRKCARIILSACAIIALLTYLTALLPLLFAGLLGWRDQPWLYPTMFGSNYLKILARDGIAGGWGRWWHQMFRLGFEAPGLALNRSLGVSSRSYVGRLLATLVAFALSGALHAAGSYTLNGETQPWAGSGMFFLVQPIGIVLEEAVWTLGQRTGVTTKLPSAVKTAAALAWTHFWLYTTAPLLLDDVAAGGVWATEVVPVSIIDGLAGNGWFKWHSAMLPSWHSDSKHWWKSGIAF